MKTISLLTTLSLCSICIALPACAQDTPTAAPDFKLVVKNGGMTQGGDTPANWRGKFGDVKPSRDTEVFKEGPSSLKVTCSAGKNGQVFQTIQGGAGATIKITGFMKSQGNVKAQALVQAFAESYKNNQFIQLKYVQGESDWARFEKEIKLPEWTSFFNVGIMVDGEGVAWLDEVHEANSPVDPGTVEDPTNSAPAKAKPSVAGWGFWPVNPSGWQARHQDFLRRTAQGREKKDINVVFFGDSITQGWGGEGKEVWEQKYKPIGAVNYGIGGDSTRQVLWRIQNGEVDGISPKLVVLKIGTNNLYDDFNSGNEAEIAEGITTVVKTLRTKLPNTKVLLLGLLPRQNEWFSNRIKKVNDVISKLDDGKSVRYLDMSPQFQTEIGKVKKELYVGDQLHLAKPGYEVWATTMQPLFDEMMK